MKFEDDAVDFATVDRLLSDHPDKVDAVESWIARETAHSTLGAPRAISQDRLRLVVRCQELINRLRKPS